MLSLSTAGLSLRWEKHAKFACVFGNSVLASSLLSKVLLRFDFVVEAMNCDLADVNYF